MDITIRRIRIDDLDAIQHFCYAQNTASEDPFNKLRISERQYAWEMKRIRQDLLAQQRYIAWVAELECDGSTKCIGYGAAIVSPHAHFFEIEMVASLGELWVDPEYRNCGVGTQLVNKIVENLNAIGIDWITVQLGGNECATTSFFEKLGFSSGSIEMRKSIAP